MRLRFEKREPKTLPEIPESCDIHEIEKLRFEILEDFQEKLNFITLACYIVILVDNKNLRDKT